MHTKNLASAAVLAASGLILAVSLPTGSTAAPRVKPEPTPTTSTPPAPTETGCYDIIGGGPTFQKFVASYTETVPGSGVFTRGGIVLSDRGVVSTSLALPAPGCTDVTYVLEVYRNDPAGELLARDSATGDGTSMSVDLDVTVLVPSREVRVQVFTRDSLGRTGDTGADGGPFLVVADADGTLPDGGGGQQFWG